jgi:hypothetical protein
MVHVAWEDVRHDGGNGNGEVYYLRSTDAGASWGPETRLTNNPAYSHEPQVAVSGPSVHVLWQDYRNGNYEIYYKGNPTGNSGVEDNTEDKRRQLDVRIKATPNPFTSFVSVLGRERERFALYDIAGRKVGDYQGDRIGEGLSPGVYFLKPEGQSAKPVRIVKVR